MDNSPLPEDKDATLVDPHHARFQRTDQWMPVYSWLESLDTDEVVKSKDILDWLSENPEIKEQLYSRHSRYHLMHYIKKCHVKILKRKEKKKGLQPSNKANYAQVHKTGATKLPVPVPWFLEFLSVVCNKLPELLCKLRRYCIHTGALSLTFAVIKWIRCLTLYSKSMAFSNFFLAYY
ncbi:uncharacterized protein LOC114267992 isoform X3 [Camellia sinensis]|uniref:uncharacterized protein LOC114267992 isoform X3 n=1 Tax=Camellia sinensis TaxID=4442 RepID=UPI001035AD63|nr:uncharacterized protein LOC114267992 isoform X3 [Camellia sinensis]